MNDVFEKRVRAAAVAGWWTLLIAVGFLLIQWIIYLLVMSARPTWLLWMWGPDSTWSFVQTVWFWSLAIMKILHLALSIGDSLADAMGKAVKKTSGWLMAGRCQPDPVDCT